MIEIKRRPESCGHIGRVNSPGALVRAKFTDAVNAYYYPAPLSGRFGELAEATVDIFQRLKGRRSHFSPSEILDAFLENVRRDVGKDFPHEIAEIESDVEWCRSFSSVVTHFSVVSSKRNGDPPIPFFHIDRSVPACDRRILRTYCGRATLFICNEDTQRAPLSFHNVANCKSFSSFAPGDYISLWGEEHPRLGINLCPPLVHAAPVNEGQARMLLTADLKP